MDKLDLKKELKEYYNPSPKEVSVATVPELRFIMTDGEGDPNRSEAFQSAVEALMSVSYTLKFMVKKGAAGIDYGVMPLEGLWWADDMAAFNVEDKSNWKWTLMVMQPEFVTPELYEKAVSEVRKKKSDAVLPALRFESYEEGLSVQIMHIGPFSEEGPTVARLHRYIDENGYMPSGKHHEIYLSDIRKAAPEKWKTVVRQPMAKK